MQLVCQGNRRAPSHGHLAAAPAAMPHCAVSEPAHGLAERSRQGRCLRSAASGDPSENPRYATVASLSWRLFISGWMCWPNCSTPITKSSNTIMMPLVAVTVAISSSMRAIEA